MDWEKYDYIKQCIVSGFVPDSVHMDSKTCACYLDIRKALNFSDITENVKNINGCAVVFETDSAFYIIQVSGYSYERGIFCDLI